jgi:hypothetical protein
MLTGILGKGTGGEKIKSQIQTYITLSKCYNSCMLQCSIALAITVNSTQQPMYATEEDLLNYPSSNTNDIKLKLSLCTSGRDVGGGIAPHILNLGTRRRRVGSFTNTNISDNKICSVC